MLTEEKFDFIRPLTDQKVTSIPDTVTFDCELSASGLPVEWYRGDRPIRRSDKYEMIAEGAVHKLVIKDVDDRDVGQYSIQVKNKASEANLIVEGKHNCETIPLYLIAELFLIEMLKFIFYVDSRLRFLNALVHQDFQDTKIFIETSMG